MKLGWILCIGLLLVSSEVLAEKYWVLGSYSEQGNALTERRRLESDLGISIFLRQFSVSGQPYYRLLILDSDLASSDQARLSMAKVNPWAVELDEFPQVEPAQIETPQIEPAQIKTPQIESPQLKSLQTKLPTTGTDKIESGRIGPSKQKSDTQNRFYWVAGSYSDVSEALEVENKLSRIFDRVSNQTTLLRGQVYHRVLVGPIPNSLVNSTKSSLSEKGFPQSWLINAEVDQVEEDPFVSALVHSTLEQAAERGEIQAGSQEDMQKSEQSIETILSVPATAYYSKQSSASEPNKKGNGYNLARLPKKKHQFLMPGKKMAKGNWYSDVAFERRQFTKEGPNGLAKGHSSLQLASEYTTSWNDEKDLFTFMPFYRWDSEDSDRTHFDIRELSWIHVFDNWELRTGIRKVFWGVTEARHLVDIINQTDNLENVNGEEKLGQGMINLSWISDWGIIDVYWLLGFREREFAGRNGRPSLPVIVDEDLAIFESAAKNARSDFALRWAQTFGELELGLSHFSGTSREPRIEAEIEFDSNGVPVDAVLIPYYEVIDQTGIDAQYFIGDWTWKLEYISRSGQGNRFNAFTFGFEKTIVGLFGSRADLGIVAEYLYDGRQQIASVISEDDFAIGFRLTLNDVADSTALLVFLMDRDSNEVLTSLEASMRIGSNWKLILDATIFSGSSKLTPGFSGILSSLTNKDEELGLFQDEDFVRIELTRYF